MHIGQQAEQHKQKENQPHVDDVEQHIHQFHREWIQSEPMLLNSKTEYAQGAGKWVRSAEKRRSQQLRRIQLSDLKPSLCAMLGKSSNT